MKHLLNAFLDTCLLTMFLACASAPKPVNTATTEVTGTQPVTEYEQAKAHRQTIQKYELYQFAADTYQTAEQAFQGGEEAYGNNEYEKARTAFNEANAQYLVIIANAFPQYLSIKEKEIMDLRSSAEEIKAQVALKNEYQTAVATWDESQKEKQAGNFEKSAELLTITYNDFDTLYTKTKEKKERAEQALEELQSKIDRIKELQSQQAPAGDNNNS